MHVIRYLAISSLVCLSLVCEASAQRAGAAPEVSGAVEELGVTISLENNDAAYQKCIDDCKDSAKNSQYVQDCLKRQVDERMPFCATMYTGCLAQFSAGVCSAGFATCLNFDGGAISSCEDFARRSCEAGCNLQYK